MTTSRFPTRQKIVLFKEDRNKKTLSCDVTKAQNTEMSGSVKENLKMLFRLIVPCILVIGSQVGSTKCITSHLHYYKALPDGFPVNTCDQILLDIFMFAEIK